MLVAFTLQWVLGNIAASRADPATAAVTWSPEVAVSSETLDFDCAVERGEPLCRFVATYELEPLVAEPPAMNLQFVGTKTSDVVLELDGTRVTGPVQIAQRSRLIARGVIHPGRFVEPSYARSAMSVRHPRFGAPVHRSHRFDFEYAIAPIRTFAGPPPKVTLHVEYPPGWKMEVAGDDEIFETIGRGGEAELDASTMFTLRVRLQVPPPTVFQGGPFAAVGWMSGHGVWARVGYELASPAPMFFSLSGETDFRRVVTLVPLVSFATESVLGIIPSFSAGAGLPIDLLDGPARLGLRGQLGLQWPYVGVVGGLDVMPGTSSLLLRGFVMLQVGL